MPLTLDRLRPKPHWTPRYIADRTALWWWTRRNPDAPWLVPSAVAFLDRWLKPTDLVVEFGSGRSTLWFARRVARVVSVEHNPAWFATVKTRLAGADAANADLRLDASNGARVEEYLAPAVAALESLARRPDLILVDGVHRDHAALWALERVARPGGLLVIDNCNRYFPSRSRSPESLGPNDAPPSPQWARFRDLAAPLRRVWFGDGVSDTLLVFT